MISNAIQEKLAGIIKENMIPEYKNMLLYKEKLKNEYVRYVENNFLTERDRDLISKYPDYIKFVEEVRIIYYYDYDKIEIESFNDYRFREDYDLEIKLDKKLPLIAKTIFSLKESDKKGWKKIGPIYYQYINARNTYVKKLNKATEFLSHKNTTITLIKKEFPELYNLYKS